MLLISIFDLKLTSKLESAHQIMVEYTMFIPIISSAFFGKASKFMVEPSEVVSVFLSLSPDLTWLGFETLRKYATFNIE